MLKCGKSDFYRVQMWFIDMSYIFKFLCSLCVLCQECCFPCSKIQLFSQVWRWLFLETVMDFSHWCLCGSVGVHLLCHWVSVPCYGCGLSWQRICLVHVCEEFLLLNGSLQECKQVVVANLTIVSRAQLCVSCALCLEYFFLNLWFNDSV